MLAWAIQGLPPTWQVWTAALQTPSAAGLSYDRQRAALEGYDLYQLLVAAQQSCPPDRPVLALSDDVYVDQQGNYVLYPQRVDIMRQADPFGADDLAAHAGGCVLYYGAEVAWRLAPFRAQLRQVACVPAGCLYRIP